MWTIWHRHHGDWQPVAEADSERAAITLANCLFLKGDVLILPAGSDPRAPAPVERCSPRHYRGRVLDTDGVAKARGRAPLLRGRVF